MTFRIQVLAYFISLLFLASCNNSQVKESEQSVVLGSKTSREEIKSEPFIDTVKVAEKEVVREIKISKNEQYFSTNKPRKITKNDFKEAIKLINKKSYKLAIVLFDSVLNSNPSFGFAYFHRANCKNKVGNPEGAMLDYTLAIKYLTKKDEAYYRRGIIKDELLNHNAAQLDFDSAYSLNSKRSDYLASRGRSKMKGKDFEGAKKDLMAAKQKESAGQGVDSVAQSYIMALASYDDALLEIEKNKPEKALEMINQAIKMAPDNGYFFYKRAEILTSANRLNEALVDYTKSIEMENDPVAYNGRGLVKFQLVDVDGALRDFDDAIERNRMYSEAFLNRGIAKAEQDSINDAISDFSKAIQIDKYEDSTQGPVFKAITYFERGRCYVKKGLFSEALADYNSSLALDSSNGNVNYERAVVRTYLGDFIGSMDDYSVTIKKDNNSATAFNNRGLVKMYLVDYAGSVKDFSQAIQTDSALTEALANRASAKIEMGDYNGAIADYDKAIEKGFVKKSTKKHVKVVPQKDVDTESHALLKRAHAKYKLQNYKGAIADYDQAILTNQNNFEAYYCRANLKHDLKDVNGALVDYDKAVELAPNNAKVYYNRGTHFFDFKIYDKALTDYSKAIELDDKLMQAFHNRGAIYQELKVYPKAIEDYTKAIYLETEAKDPMLKESLKHRGISKIKIKDKTSCEDIKQASQLGATGMGDYLKKCK